MSPTRRRGLGDVLHYFIPEEEQEEARARARGGAASAPARWVLLSDPLRPLDRSLATDLAGAFSVEAGPLQVIAPFAGPASGADGPNLRWNRVELRDAGGDAERIGPLGEAVRSADPGAHLLAAVPPSFTTALWAWLGPGTLTGWLLPVEGTPWGLSKSLARLRRLREADGRSRVGAFLVGVDRSSDGADSLHQLEKAAARQLGLPVEDLGAVVRDEASYRALLMEAPVGQIEPDAESSQSLREIARRMLRSRTASQ